VIKGILFDLDGTLLDHRGAADAAITGRPPARRPGHPGQAEAATLWAGLERPVPGDVAGGRMFMGGAATAPAARVLPKLAVPAPADFAERYRRGWPPAGFSRITSLAGLPGLLP